METIISGPETGTHCSIHRRERDCANLACPRISPVRHTPLAVQPWASSRRPIYPCLSLPSTGGGKLCFLTGMRRRFKGITPTRLHRQLLREGHLPRPHGHTAHPGPAVFRLPSRHQSLTLFHDLLHFEIPSPTPQTRSTAGLPRLHKLYIVSINPVAPFFLRTYHVVKV